MPSLPQLPDNAPFTLEQRSWLNGWIAGVLSSQVEVGSNAAAVSAAPPLPLLVLYGTQTGTAEGLAKRLAKQAQAKGFAPIVLGLDEYTKADLAICERLLVITSTRQAAIASCASEWEAPPRTTRLSGVLTCHSDQSTSVESPCPTITNGMSGSC